MSEDAKRAILARRARFVAAAMASAGLLSCDKQTPPGACLSVVVAQPPSEPSPLPCLSPAITPPEPPDAGVDAGSPDARSPAPPPMPCLRVAPPPPDSPPQICLSPPREPHER